MGNAIRWSVDQLNAYRERRGAPSAPRVRRREPAEVILPKPELEGRKMNSLEIDYAQHLAARQAAGEILSWGFERIRLRLARRTFFTPDFDVLLPDHLIEIHEAKGYWKDDARVKIKVAADIYRGHYRFFGIRRRRERDGGGWDVERF